MQLNEKSAFDKNAANQIQIFNFAFECYVMYKLTVDLRGQVRIEHKKN